MPSFTPEDKKIVKLYEKAMVDRQQQEERMQTEAIKELDDNFWQYCGARLKAVVQAVPQLYNMKGVSKAQIDTAEREISDLITLTRMYTTPEVVNQLMNEAVTKYLKDKMIKKVITS